MSALEPIEPSPSANPIDAFPRRPDFQPLRNTAERQRLFGAFEFVHEPYSGDAGAFRILGDWVAQNITTVEISGLKGVPTYGGLSSGLARFHRKAAAQIVELWSAWQSAGLMDRVIFWGGSFVPRFIRGSATGELSPHAFGAAFDINVADNRLGCEPARIGERGCVRELVELANAHGFYWGGHFEGRPDGMHFEIAQLREDDCVLST